MMPSPTSSPLEPVPEDTDLSIDSLLNKGLKAIYGILRACLAQSRTGDPSRESVQNLKDAMCMLHDLKKQEQDLLEDLSDESLEKLAKGKK